MLPALSWEQDEARRGPSVVGRLRERTLKLDSKTPQCVVVALLFALPDSPVIAGAERKVDYFHARTGALWDLYFPGFYRYGGTRYDPQGVRLAGHPDDGPWFSPRGFNEIRQYVTCSSTWQFSGNADLVLVNAYLSEGTEPVVDWESTLGGPLVDANDRFRHLSLAEVIERISQEIESNYESADWNVATDLWPSDSAPPSGARQFAADVLANVFANVLSRPLTG